MYQFVPKQKYMNDNLVTKLLEEVSDLKTQLIELKVCLLQESKACPELRREFLPVREIMQYLDYKPTQMSSFINEHNLVKVKFGKRILLSTRQLLQLLQLVSQTDNYSSFESEKSEKENEILRISNKKGNI